jgi:hypothetical protein
MDFVVGLPCTQRGFDSIWVIVDRLTKVAHFLPVKTTYIGARLGELFMEKIMCQRRSYLIEVLSLHHTSGRRYIDLWGRS